MSDKTTLPEPVAWRDDGSTRAGSTATAFRVITAETKADMPNASAVNFNEPLYPASALQEALDRAKGERDVLSVHLDMAHSERVTLEAVLDNARKVIKGLVECPSIADVDHCDQNWGCEETAQAERAARQWLVANPKEIKG